MHRVKVYPGQVVLDQDFMNNARYCYGGVAEFFRACMGNGPLMDGFDCTPNAGLSVAIAAGSIYLLGAMDPTAYGSLAVDNHVTVKQGLSPDPVNLNCPAPVTAGQAINYLVQIGFQQVDGNPQVLPFYDSAHPDVLWMGPNNDNSTSSTTRRNDALVQIKAGAAATQGAQVTPTPDAGFSPAWVVEVRQGQTTPPASQIYKYFDANFIEIKLSDLGQELAPVAWERFGY